MHSVTQTFTSWKKKSASSHISSWMSQWTFSSKVGRLLAEIMQNKVVILPLPQLFCCVNDDEDNSRNRKTNSAVWPQIHQQREEKRDQQTQHIRTNTHTDRSAFLSNYFSPSACAAEPPLLPLFPVRLMSISPQKLPRPDYAPPQRRSFFGKRRFIRRRDAANFRLNKSHLVAAACRRVFATLAISLRSHLCWQNTAEPWKAITRGGGDEGGGAGGGAGGGWMSHFHFSWKWKCVSPPCR